MATIDEIIRSDQGIMGVADIMAATKLYTPAQLKDMLKAGKKADQDCADRLSAKLKTSWGGCNLDLAAEIDAYGDGKDSKDVKDKDPKIKDPKTATLVELSAGVAATPMVSGLG